MWILIIVIILIFAYLYLILPTLRKHPSRELCDNLYVAHRGLHNIDQGVPENSMLSFKKAIDHGFAIEIDIHITKDKKVIIFHDDNLKRVCGTDRIIEEMTLDELSRYRLLGTDEKIPQLSDLLEICDENTVLVIEYKCTPKNYKDLCRHANEILRRYNVKYIMQSFNPLALHWYKKHAKDICRGQLSTNFFKNKSKKPLEIICGYLLLNFLSRPDFVSYDVKYPNTLSRRICVFFGAIKAGWTIRSQKELDSCKNDNSIYIFENFIPDIKETGGSN